MKKTLLLAAALVCSVAAVSADETAVANSMNVHMTEAGVTESVVLSRIKSITFGTGIMNVNLDDETTLNIKMADVEKIDFFTSSSVETVVDEATAPKLSHMRGTSTLTVTGIAEGTNAAVYDLSGRRVLSTVIDGNLIDITNLTDGQIYVFVTDGLAAKFIK